MIRQVKPWVAVLGLSVVGLMAQAGLANGADEIIWDPTIGLSPAGSDAQRVSIETGADGTTAAAWFIQQPAGWAIQAAVKRPGQTDFSNPSTVSPYGVDAGECRPNYPNDPCHHPALTVGPDGTVTVAWAVLLGGDDFSSRSRIQATTLLPGRTTFSNPADLGRGTFAELLDIAVAEDGAVTVAWRTNCDPTPPCTSALKAATLRPGATSFDPEEEIARYSYPDYMFEAQISAGPSGVVTGVWRVDRITASETSYRLMTATRPGFDQGFSEFTNLATGTAAATPGAGTSPPPFSEPQVAVSPGGDMVISWISTNYTSSAPNQWTRSSESLKIATRPAGTSSFSTPKDLATTPGSLFLSWKLKFASEGSAVLVWTQLPISGGWSRGFFSTAPPGSLSFTSPTEFEFQRGSFHVVRDILDFDLGPDGSMIMTWLGGNDSSAPGYQPGTPMFNAFVPYAAGRKAGSQKFSTPTILASPCDGVRNPTTSVSPDGRASVVWYRTREGIPAGCPAAGARSTSSSVQLRTGGWVSGTRLGLKVTGPRKAPQRKWAFFKVSVENRGAVTASGIKIRVRAKGHKAQQNLGDLLPGKSRKSVIRLFFRKAGKTRLRFKVTSPDAKPKSVSKIIRVLP